MAEVVRDINFQARSSFSGKKFEDLCVNVLEVQGFRVLERKAERYGIEIDIIAEDRAGAEVWFECKGGYEGKRPGASRTDSMLKFLGAYQIIEWESGGDHPPYRLLTSGEPQSGRAWHWFQAARAHGIEIHVLSPIPDVAA